MKKYLVMICLSILVSQEHFIVEINETGESTLFIFEDTITTLAIGDEIGIFDEAGIIDDSGNIVPGYAQCLQVFLRLLSLLILYIILLAFFIKYCLWS